MITTTTKGEPGITTRDARLTSSQVDGIESTIPRSGARAASGRNDRGVATALLSRELALDLHAAEIQALEEALSDLRRIDERCHRAIELQFLGGLSVAEIAGALRISPETVEHDLKKARAFLYRAVRR